MIKEDKKFFVKLMIMNPLNDSLYNRIMSIGDREGRIAWVNGLAKHILEIMGED